MLKNNIILTLSFLSLTLCVPAYSEVSADQLARVKALKEQLKDVDTRSINQISNELESSPGVEEELEILEAEAATFHELVNKYQLTDSQARIRFFDRIRMNMAYFQLGGSGAEQPQDRDLDIVIRRKLKEHLSSELLANTKFFHPIE